jgi:hypothetical protein
VHTPEGQYLDAVLLRLENLLLEGGNMLGAPIIGQFANPQAREHFRTFFWATFFCIEWHNTPSHQILSSKQLAGGDRLGGWTRGIGRDHRAQNEQNSGAQTSRKQQSHEGSPWQGVGGKDGKNMMHESIIERTHHPVKEVLANSL